MNQYPLPQTTKDSYNRWKINFIPDDSQNFLMDLVAESLDQGLFYSRDIFGYVENKMKDILPFDYQREIDQVENGVLGMEVYYARQAVEAMREQNKVNEVLNKLQLTEGKWLGTIKFNNGTTIHRIKIVSIIDSKNINCLGVRGGKTVKFMVSALSIEAGLNRRGKNFDNLLSLPLNY